MALIVEDGSIVAGAESYVSVANADVYHSNFGNAAWAVLATPAKESALRKATGYMQQVYRLRWKGTRTGTTQVLDWPRFGVFVEDVAYAGFPYYVGVNVIPAEVQNACAELALKSSTTDLAPDVEREVVREKIGPLETEYAPGTPQYVRYRAIDLMLKIYLETTGISGKLVRA